LSSLNVLEDLITIIETFNKCKAYEKNCETAYTSVAIKEDNNTLRQIKIKIDK